MTLFEQENFCNHEASHLLKSIGFKGKCLGRWFGLEFSPTNGDNQNMMEHEGEAAAPLFTQAVKYFREVHSIEINVSWQGDGGFYLNINLVRTLKNEWERLYRGWHKTEHEAYNAAIIAACKKIKNTPKT